MKARVTVTLKNGVLDPQGKAIEGALGSLGFSGVDQVRQGKVFDLVLQETDKAKADNNGFLHWTVELPGFGRKTVELKYLVRKHADVVGV